jgi:hypothetical protein
MRVDMFQTMYHADLNASLRTDATPEKEGHYWMEIEQGDHTFTLHFQSHTHMVNFFDQLDNQLSGMLETPAEELRVLQSHLIQKSPSV